MQERTFGEELNRLAHAVDAVNEDQMRRIYAASSSYVDRALRVKKLELLEEVALREGRGLQPVLDRYDPYPAYPVRSSEDRTNGINAFAFEVEKNLWVTVPEKRDGTDVLADVPPADYEELWNRTSMQTEFTRIEPEERGYEREEARTLISIPVFNGQRICRGIVYFESPERLVPTPRVQREFERIAAALGRLDELRIQDKQRRDQTAKAIDELADSENEFAFHYPYSAPVVFGIYPEGIDRNILTAVKDVVEAGDFIWATWEEMSEDGLVNEQVERRLGESKYLIAYLSEPEPETDGGADGNYVDNPNVLYELGLFRALTRVPSEPPTAAMIIRERVASRPPFDLAAYRRLEVPRHSGSVDYAALRDSLQSYFAAMTGTE